MSDDLQSLWQQSKPADNLGALWEQAKPLNVAPSPELQGTLNAGYVPAAVVGFARGAKDVLDSGAHGLAWLADKTGLTNGEYQRIAEADRQGRSQFEQAAANSDYGQSANLGRVVGQVDATLPVSRITPFGSKAAGLKWVANNAAQGGLSGALTSSATDNSGPHDALVGALLGATIPTALEGIRKVSNPLINQSAQFLADHGVTLTPGQILGGAMQRIEDAATSVPFLGDMIKNAQKRSIESFNTAAFNDSLSDIGEKLPKNIPAGRDAVQYAADKIGQEYNRILAPAKVAADPQFQSDVGQLWKNAQNLPQDSRAQFDRILQNEVLDRFTSHGLMNGETYKGIDSTLGKISADLNGSTNYDDRILGGAVRELKSSLRQALERSTPGISDSLQNADSAYAKFLRVQQAAGMLGAKEGVFTPAQLANAVKGLDSSGRKAAFARGNALMQDLAENGKSVLSQTVPDSGTPMRGLVNLGILGAAGHSIGMPPAAIPAVAAASSVYTNSGQKLAQALLAGDRPELMKLFGNGIGAAMPVSAPLSAALANNLATLSR